MTHKDGMELAKLHKERAEASQRRQIELMQRQSQYMLGQPADNIAKVLNEIEEKQLGVIPEAPGNLGDVWHGGTASLTFGLIFGNLDAKITFDDGRWEFDTNFWGFGASGAVAAGGGPWGDGWNSPNGLEMGFEVTTAAITGGILQVFWIYDGMVVGSFVGPAAGAGIATGGGKGKWKKIS